ncbi:MAG: hypothetical protein ACOC5R_04285 [Elusimicrobiota bacterium]
MKNIIAALVVLSVGLSVYFLMGRFSLSFKSWLWISGSPFLIVALLAIYGKNIMVQAVITPFLFIHGAGTILFLPFKTINIYAFTGAVVMLVMVVYIVFTQIIRLKILRLVLGICVGAVLFFIYKYFQIDYIRNARLKRVPHLENKLLY